LIPVAGLDVAQVDFDDGERLFSPLYDDVYASTDGAFAQAAHVFVAGNELPARWRNARRFVIVETGFGAAINFLCAWEAWRSSAAPGGRLHYISVEKHPFARADLERALARWPHCRALAAELLDKYPPLVPGFRRVFLDAGRVVLTLLFGDVAEVLPELVARADAFFLDGFAPAKNEAMWSDHVFAEIARLAAPGATAATYTVAARVREGLERAGFAVRKAPGFGRKQEMLRARFAARDQIVDAPSAPARAVVVGAGLAGSACAARLAAHGWDVEVIERHAGPAREASGNPAGLVMPAFSLDWNVPTRLAVSGFLYALPQLEIANDAWHPTGVLQLARDEGHFARHRQIVERYRLPPELLRMVTAEEGSALVGQRVAGPGWWLASAGWGNPPRVCADQLTRVTCQYDRFAAGLRRAPDEQWEIADANGHAIARAPLVVVANAHAACALLGENSLPLGVTRGQVTLVPQSANAALHAPVCRDGYITPAVGELHCVGASYDTGSDDLTERTEDHRENLQRLERLLPGYAADVDPTHLHGRVALRTVASDRMPLLGRWPSPGLTVCLALASRGLTYAPLLADTLACMLDGDPLPIERGLLAKLDPARFAGALQTEARSW
jgi:tRNA 5-methylaminomethyl-2-thiouridine biosynthesis bifunctional protein